MSTHSVPMHESYLIVGGGTLLGESIVDQLLRRGETRVSIFDAQPLAAEQATRFSTVRVYVGDVLTPEGIADAVKSVCSTRLHVTSLTLTAVRSNMRCPHRNGLNANECSSSQARYPTTFTPPPSIADDKKRQVELLALHKKVNTDGMRNVLAAALESSVTQLVYVGNADVVFDGRDRSMLREEDAPYPAKCWEEAFEPQSQGERMALSFNGVNALRTAAIRPAMLFGPGSGTAMIFRRLQASPRLAGFQMGDNKTLVDRTYVDNVAHAAILAADRLNLGHAQHTATAGRAFFITNGEPRPFWDFMRALWVATGGAPPEPVVAGKGTVMLVAGVKEVVATFKGQKTGAWGKMKFLCANRTYDMRLAREVLGYTPIVSYDEGIRRTAEWWLQQQLKICKEKGAMTGVAPPPYNDEEATLLTEKSPFF